MLEFYLIVYPILNSEPESNLKFESNLENEFGKKTGKE
jgi:hypothetical protein